MRQVRQHDAEYVAGQLERKRRARREDSERRNAENAAKRRKYHDEQLSKLKGANAKFKKFLDVYFGFACSVCDRLWFQDDLACISNVTNAAKKKSALDVLARDFPGDDVANFKVCRACKDSLLEGKIPPLSKTNGYAYPPIPPHLPQLNVVEERLVAPRIPFMSIRRLSHGGGQFGIKGQVVNVPIDVQKTVQSLPRGIDDDVAINVNLKRRLLAKPTYATGTVRKDHIKAWLGVLLQSPLYKYHNIRFNPHTFESLPPEGQEIDDNEVEKLIDVDDANDPTQCVVAMNASSHTVVYDDACMAGLQNHSHVLDIAPGEGQTPISLLHDTTGEELSFPQIYLGQPRKILSDRVTPFSLATSEIRRTDRRGVQPTHVLYMAMKVIRHRMVEKTITFRSNRETDAITRKQLEEREFVQSAIDQDLAFMRGVPNTTHYWMEKKREVFAMIRQLGKPTVFLTMSASEVHWKRLISLLEKLRVQGNPELQRSIDDLRLIDASDLVNNDPVVCAIYANRLFDTIINILKDKVVSLFKPYYVVDFFKRVEFQHRGSPHVHVLLWLNNAPDEELTMDMPKMIAMAEVLMSLDSSLLPRERSQMHQHTHTCYKNNRSVCRFGAPFMPSDETMIVVPFPPTDVPEELQKRDALKQKYRDMHASLEETDYETAEDFFQMFNITSKQQ